MEKRAKVSVIVAAYNAEKSLGRCVEALLAQRLGDIEVVLVDDGSSDGTGGICDGYARRDDRVRALHQPNRGCGAARNSGARVARGEYIGFADADDWIEPEMYSLLYSRAIAAGADIAMCDYFRERGGSERRASRVDPAFLGVESFNKDTMAREPRKRSFFGAVVCWNKIFRREFYESTVSFAEDISIAEDVPAVFKALARARRICAVDRKLYHYHAVGESSSRVRDRRAMDVFAAFDILVSDMVENDYGMFRGFAIRSAASDALHHFKSIDGRFKREYLARMSEFAARLEKEGLLGLVGGKDAFKIRCLRRLGFALSNLIARI